MLLLRGQNDFRVTAIAGDPQQTLEFYVGILGLRLVKQTVNYDDPGSIHAKCLGHSTANLRNLERVREACPVRIALMIQKDLRFVLQSRKGLGVDNSVSVVLVESTSVGRIVFTVLVMCMAARIFRARPDVD